jgi:hypothetical protein
MTSPIWSKSTLKSKGVDAAIGSDKEPVTGRRFAKAAANA